MKAELTGMDYLENNGTRFYFYSRYGSTLPSPYFQSLLSLHASSEKYRHTILNIWHGSHYAPILANEQGAV